jgi:hypothetical protein
MGQLQTPLLDVVKTALEAAVRHRRQLLRGSDCSTTYLQSQIYNPMTAGSPTAGSQMGSQRRQAVTDSGRRPATIGAGRRLIRRRPATVRDGRIAPCKRQVSGSNPLTGSTFPNDHSDSVPSTCQMGSFAVASDGASATLDSPALPGGSRQLSDEAPPRLS